MTQSDTTAAGGVVIYSSPFCGYCAAAKALLAAKQAQFLEIDILADPAKRREMIERCGRRTVPQVFIGTRHIGGFDDLKVLDEQGGLDELLAAI